MAIRRVPDCVPHLYAFFFVTAGHVGAACLGSLSSDPKWARTSHVRCCAGAFRALTLWSYDQSLVFALDVAKALSQPVEYLMALWPCAGTFETWRVAHEHCES